MILTKLARIRTIARITDIKLKRSQRIGLARKCLCRLLTGERIRAGNVKLFNALRLRFKLNAGELIRSCIAPEAFIDERELHS